VVDSAQSHDSPSLPPRAPSAAPEGLAEPEKLLTPGQVARLFGVDPKTVTRWAAAGRIKALHTLGGHRRYRAAEVHDLLNERRVGR
jgi:excisionase family DNA binding protein